MKTILLAVLALGMASRPALADEEFEAARAALDEAAKKFASVYTTKLTGDSDRAFLGVLIGDQDDTGVQIVGVTPDGGAELAGVVADDVIIEINGETLAGHRRPGRVLTSVLDDVTPGETVRIVVERDGEEIGLDVNTTGADIASFSSFPFERSFDWTSAIPNQFRFGYDDQSARRGGVQLIDIGSDLGDYFGVDSGVLVLDTPGGSELMPGDIVRRIDDADVSNSADAYRLMGQAEESVTVEVRRKNRTIDVSVEPSERGASRSFRIFRGGEVDVEVAEDE